MPGTTETGNSPAVPRGRLDTTDRTCDAQSARTEPTPRGTVGSADHTRAVARRDRRRVPACRPGARPRLRSSSPSCIRRGPGRPKPPSSWRRPGSTRSGCGPTPAPSTNPNPTETPGFGFSPPPGLRVGGSPRGASGPSVVGGGTEEAAAADGRRERSPHMTGRLRLLLGRPVRREPARVRAARHRAVSAVVKVRDLRCGRGERLGGRVRRG